MAAASFLLRSGGRSKSISSSTRRQKKKLELKRKKDLISKISNNNVGNTNKKQYTAFILSKYVKMKTFETFEEAELGLIELIKNNMIKRHKERSFSDKYEEDRPGKYINIRINTYRNIICYVGIVTNNSINHSLLNKYTINELRDGIIKWKIKYEDLLWNKKYERMKETYHSDSGCFSYSKKKKEYEKNKEELLMSYRECKFKICRYRDILEDISDLEEFFKNRFEIGIDKEHKYKYKYSDDTIQLFNEYIEKFNSSEEYYSDTSNEYYSDSSSTE